MTKQFPFSQSINAFEHQKLFHFDFRSIFAAHDEVKDKLFKMELSWVCEESNGVHQLVPTEWYNKAYAAGMDAKRDDDSDNEI